MRGPEPRGREGLHERSVLLPKETGYGKPIPQDWFERLLKELTDEFGGATSFSARPATACGAAAAKPSGTTSPSSRS